ncbi:MAG: hypothetical protein KGV50_00345 [Gammaproteobacteria bacterium]|nr:hypothetical protein [Gammaproteobacteria bacterium]
MVFLFAPNEKWAIKRASDSRQFFDKAYQGCKEELRASEPKREDFKPLAVL